MQCLSTPAWLAPPLLKMQKYPREKGLGLGPQGGMKTRGAAVSPVSVSISLGFYHRESRFSVVMAHQIDAAVGDR